MASTAKKPSLPNATAFPGLERKKSGVEIVEKRERAATPRENKH
jgi:hypothetical protein